MTYAEYIKECQRRQRAYIRGERKRMAKAQKLFQRYTAAMAAIELHPLGRMEIGDRQRQLDDMERRVPETHGDSEAMQAAYEMRFGESVS